MTTQPPSEIQVDVSRNLLRVRYLGRVTAAGMPVYVKRMQDLLPQMRKGFTLLTDLSGLDSMEIECMTGIAKIMEACKAKGVGIVVRIIPARISQIGMTNAPHGIG